jgi:hypothetical protein
MFSLLSMPAQMIRSARFAGGGARTVMLAAAHASAPFSPSASTTASDASGPFGTNSAQGFAAASVVNRDAYRTPSKPAWCRASA